MDVRRVGMIGAVVLGSLGTRPARAGEIPVASPGALPTAVAQAKPGDTLILANGKYTDQVLELKTEGAEGRPITLRAATPGQAVFTGKSHLQVQGAWLVVDGLAFEGCTTNPVMLEHVRNCRLTNVSVLRCNPEDNTRMHWIRLAGGDSRDNRIDHCYTDGKTKDGVVLTVEGGDGKMPQNTRIDHNRFRNVTKAVQNGMETIRIGTSDYSQLDAHSVVEFNLFENCSGDAEIISSKSCANIYRYNTFVECDGGVVMRHGHRCVVEGNWFFGNGKKGSAGIRVHGSDHRVVNNYLTGLGQFSLAFPAGSSKYVAVGHEPTLRCQVVHNTVVEPAGPAIVLGADFGKMSAGAVRDTVPEGLTFVNNLVYGTQGTLVELLAEVMTENQGNLLWAAGQAASGLPGEVPGVDQTDPKLVKGADGLYRPGPGSPALGAGAATPFPVPDDIEGQPRAGKPDIGADQKSDAPVTRRPLKPEDVGPAWMRRG